MSRTGRKDLMVDHNKFLKTVENYIKKHNIHGVFLGHQGGSDLVAGEKKLVTIIKEDSSICTQNILNKAKEMAEGPDDEDLEFDTWRGKEMFPPLPCAPTSKTWDYEARRSYLRTMFNRLGFYKGSFKSIKEPSHCPDGFPANKLSWATFGERGGPNGAKKQDADKIIQAFFDHYMPGTKMSTYYRGYVQEDVSDDQSRRPLPTVSRLSAAAATPSTPGPSTQPTTLIQPPSPSEQEDFNDGHVLEDRGEDNTDRQDASEVEQEDEDLILDDSELNDSELYQQMINDDIVAEEERINDEETNDEETSRVPQTPEVPASSFDTTVHFDRSAGRKKRARNILDQSGSETENDGSTFIEYEYDEEVPPYMKLRLNNIAEREAAMKAAEEAGLF